MTCSRSESLFEAHLDGTLVPAQRARLLAHLRGCGRCRGVLDELRAVDALLASPRAIELPQNFTFSTMAEVRTLTPPRTSSAPLVAYLVSYLVAAWLLIGAGFLLAPAAMRGAGETAVDVSAVLARSLGGFSSAGVRFASDFGSLGTLLGSAILLEAVLAVAIAIGFAVVRPRVSERARS